MCGVDKVYRHLPERVRRLYKYVQNVPRHLTDVVELRPTHIVQAWFLAHFPKIFSVDPNTDYIENSPVAARWKLQKGHGEGVTYRSLLDHLQFDDVCCKPYEEHREI